MASHARTELITVEDFLDINFGDRKAELDNGVIRMMAGGTFAHARVQGNIFRHLAAALRGSGCRPFGSDAGVLTNDVALRYPDVSVFCGRDGAEHDRERTANDPRAIFEVLSESTSAYDLTVKLAEYRAIPTVDAIVFVDPEGEKIRALNRTGPNAWTDAWLDAGEAIALPTLGTSLPWHEVFARD